MCPCLQVCVWVWMWEEQTRGEGKQLESRKQHVDKGILLQNIAVKQMGVIQRKDIIG